MPDMKTELMKLNNLKFDDAEDEPTMAVVDDATSERERVWNYIKANPMSSANDVAAALGVNAAHAASQIFALHNKAILARGLVGNVYHYQVVGDSYPRFDRQAHGKKVGAMLKGKPKMRKLKAKAQATVNDVQVKALTTAVESNFSVDEMLNTMPIAKARALYDALKKIFGG